MVKVRITVQKVREAFPEASYQFPYGKSKEGHYLDLAKIGLV